MQSKHPPVREINHLINSIIRKHGNVSTWKAVNTGKIKTASKAHLR